MSLRQLAPLVVATIALPAAAQTIEYDTGEYQYAETLPPSEQEAVVTRTLPAEQDVRPAERVIEARRPLGPPPVFVRRPVIQPVSAPLAVEVVENAPTAGASYASGTAAPVTEAQATPPVYAAAPVYTYPAPAAPVTYAYSAGGASRVIYPGAPQPVAHPGYAVSPAGAFPLAAALPAGAQIVAFDRATWVADCRARLAGYAPEDRAAVIASLGGAGASDCEGFLESYMARAASGAFGAAPVYGQQYMLVPTTVVVPQQPVYREYSASGE